MPTGVYPRTEYHRKVNSESHLGIIMPTRTQKHKDNLSKVLKNKHTSPNTEFKKGHKDLVPINSRRISAPKISEAKRRYKFTKKHILNMGRGKSHYNWKDGKTPENKKIRHSIEYRLWREAVFARDNWTCQKTGIKGGKLYPHHLQNFAQYPELRFAIDNGITLSEESHKKFHKIYGMKNNTNKQYEDWRKNG